MAWWDLLYLPNLRENVTIVFVAVVVACCECCWFGAPFTFVIMTCRSCSIGFCIHWVLLGYGPWASSPAFCGCFIEVLLQKADAVRGMDGWIDGWCWQLLLLLLHTRVPSSPRTSILGLGTALVAQDVWTVAREIDKALAAFLVVLGIKSGPPTKPSRRRDWNTTQVSHVWNIYLHFTIHLLE